MPTRLALVYRLLLTAGLALVLLTTSAFRHGDTTTRVLVGTLTVVACAALLLTETERGRPPFPVRPAVSTAAVVVLALCGVLVCVLLPDSGGPAIPLVVSRLTSQVRLRAWGRYALLVVAAASLAAYNAVSDGPWWAVPAWAVGVGVLYQSGLRVQSRRQQLEAAELLLAQEQALRQEQVRSAAAAERTRIARELHDVLAHTLSGLTVTLQATAALLEAEGASAASREQVARARALAVDGLAEARTAVASLAVETDPAKIDLVAVVERQVREHRVTTGTEAALDVADVPADLPPAVVGAVSRILREALTNAVRHAPGRPVHVRLHGRGGRLELQVDVDEGGRAPEPVPGGMGLPGMRERARDLGGDLVAGPYAQGWRVTAVLPVEAEAGSRG